MYKDKVVFSDEDDVSGKGEKKIDYRNDFKRQLYSTYKVDMTETDTIKTKWI
jgi:hypothetical protein